MMKTALILVFVCFSSFVYAQSNDNDLAVIQKVFGKEKRDLVSKFMGFDTKPNDPFWALYDQYEGDRQSLSRERLSILQDYSRMYETLDDESATSLAKRLFSNDMAYVKFHERYFKKFSKIMGGKNAAKFMQFELYLQNAIKMSILNSIPFIGELKMNTDSLPAH
ncbi:hypothetical protein [Chitinophaga sp. Cy-1792]|uniref:hypothetical protein n=1 Tax=Chitinophaga sp. Cy-1792 TaxID=2608339 RepID=UPI00142239DE|nr:hypothetical protein [Chitinophaga sp. Cy-1792]NIG55154.1 hypothetical protein [Chitinophaga sp. Cy-1792]